MRKWVRRYCTGTLFKIHNIQSEATETRSRKEKHTAKKKKKGRKESKKTLQLGEVEFMFSNYNINFWKGKEEEEKFVCSLDGSINLIFSWLLLLLVLRASTQREKEGRIR